MSQNGLALIKQRLSSMSPVEKKIANCILADPSRAVNSTIGRLAADAGTAVSSVVNFAVSLGFKGFSELKINLAQNLSEVTGAQYINASAADDPKAAMRNLITRTNVSFEDTYAAMEGELVQAGDMLLQASRIEIFGAGGSLPLAQDACYRLMRLGLPVSYNPDAVCSSLSASQISSDACALVISHTGRTASVLAAANLAKARGARVIAVTSFAVSPLTQLADVSLLAISGEATSYQEALVARLTKLLLIDSLCAYISAKRGMEDLPPPEYEIEAAEDVLRSDFS